jgi:hypothetical protein
LLPPAQLEVLDQHPGNRVAIMLGERAAEAGDHDALSPPIPGQPQDCIDNDAGRTLYDLPYDIEVDP